jgi:hypothetical protein
VKFSVNFLANKMKIASQRDEKHLKYLLVKLTRTLSEIKYEKHFASALTRVNI